MSLIQFFRILYARWLVIAVVLASCVIVAGVTAQFLPKRYLGSARILLDVAKPDPVTGDAINSRSVQSYIRTQGELVRDYEIAGIVVDRLGWANDIQVQNNLGAAANAQGMDLRRFLAQNIIGNTSVDLVPSTTIMQISYTASSPNEARQIAGLLRDTYLQETLNERKSTAGRTADWYDEQSNKALSRLRDAEKNRNDFAKANGIVLDSNNVDVESSQLATLMTESTQAKLQAPAQVAQQSGVSTLAQIDQQIAQASMTLGPNHPTLIALKRQRATVAAALASAPQAAGSNAGAIERAYEQQKSKVMAQRDKIDRLRQLQNEVDLRRDQYVKAVQRTAEFRLQSDVGDVGMTPIGDATAPLTPTFPNIPFIMIGAVGIGVTLGVVLALLLELLKRRVRSEEDLHAASGAPVLATIGTTRPPNSLRSKLIRFMERDRTRAAENALVQA